MLEPPDIHYVSSALGWIELGNTQEARADLANVSSAVADHPDVLEVRWTLAAAEKDWMSAVGVSQRLIDTDASRVSAWLHRAYALRRAEGWGLTAAWDALFPAAEKFPREATIPYNLACYACQLGQMDDALQWLARAWNVGNKKHIKTMALADEDLKPFWAEVSKW